MTTDEPLEYPAAAYAPTGVLWWRLTETPGSARPFGDERKIAAYLAFHVRTNGVFTMRQLRQALGGDARPNDAEHLNRRLRALRNRDKWTILSGKDDASLAHDEYRVRVIGWHPGSGVDRARNDSPTEVTRRKVFARDKSVCQVCFTPAGEPYVDLPDKVARPTIGHRTPGRRLDSLATVDELQTECARCNEAIRDELFDPVSLSEVMPTVRNLRRQEKTELLAWLAAGRRTPSRVEQVYAEVRRLTPGERRTIMTDLATMTEQNG